ncbi:hypothetical protein D3P07_25055 [Paenibacillus sp. 1011MAR3C5]|nr:hypothetical protein D3P07_25055 [Paenibacillus sp. 1011MAR3C5]
MLNAKFSIHKLIFVITLLSSLIPLQSFEIPALYFFMPIRAFFFVFMLAGKVKILKVSRVILFLFVIIIIEIYISTFFGTTLACGHFIFPGDSI